jgi:allantoinase
MEVLGQHGPPATVSSSGRAVERLPLLAQDAVRHGHEISAQGGGGKAMPIARAVAPIKAVTGSRPVGWQSGYACAGGGCQLRTAGGRTA